jgi:hypothetical protein
MSYLLNVSYADKDEAKALGAFWMPECKSWVIPDHIEDINPFNKWMPNNLGCIVRKPYLLCLSKTNCWKCGNETPMVALAAKNYYYYEYNDVNAPENDEQLWLKAEDPTLFSSVITMDTHVIEYLKQHYPFVKKVYSHTAEETYFGNTCIACGKLQGDFYHHEEPGGAFFPDPYEGVPTGITFRLIDLEYDYNIEASYGGMAYDDLDL